MPTIFYEIRKAVFMTPNRMKIIFKFQVFEKLADIISNTLKI
jgi:hypothetical protein